jgi:hypothetical protein
MEANQENLDTKIDGNQEKKEARTDSNNEKFEVLRGTLVSRMDIHQVRTMFTQEGMEAKMDMYQEKVEAATYYILSELEETIEHWLEDILSCVEQKTQGLSNELTEKIYGI